MPDVVGTYLCRWMGALQIHPQPPHFFGILGCVSNAVDSIRVTAIDWWVIGFRQNVAVIKTVHRNSESCKFQKGQLSISKWSAKFSVIKPESFLDLLLFWGLPFTEASSHSVDTSIWRISLITTMITDSAYTPA